FRVLVARAEQEGAETREWTYLRKDGSPLSVTLSVTVCSAARNLARICAINDAP
ncbi:putative sensor/response regulator hybrid, partial [Pseudomonas phage vB_Pae_CF177b]